MVLTGEECFAWSGLLGTPPAKCDNLGTDQDARYLFGRAIKLFQLQDPSEFSKQKCLSCVIVYVVLLLFFVVVLCSGLLRINSH